MLFKKTWQKFSVESTIIQMKNSLEGLNNIAHKEESINFYWIEINREYTTWRAEKNIINKNEKNLRKMWDTITWIKIHVTEQPEGEVRGKGTEKIFKEIIAKKLPKFDEIN